MRKNLILSLFLAALSNSVSWAAPGDYDPSYEQGGGYGTSTLDERVAKLEKKLSGESLLEMLNRMEQLQSDVLRLRGEVEELNHQLETVKRQQKDMYLDLDRRLQSATAPAQTQEQPPSPDSSTTGQEGAEAPQTLSPALVPPTQPAPAQPPAVQPPVKPLEPPRQPTPAPAVPARTLQPSPASAAPSADSAARQAAYQKGFNLLKDGKYADAIKEFKGFLATYPRGEYSDNAAYWLAEAHYVNRDLTAAREAFRKMVKEFPQAPKVSDAQLKLGYIDYDTGQWISARDSLSDVVKRFPDTSAAKLAQKRLEKMKQEGH